MCNIFTWVTNFLCAIGAINWGLVVFFQFNLVEWVDKMFGTVGLDKILYAIVALAGIYLLILVFYMPFVCNK